MSHSLRIKACKVSDHIKTGLKSSSNGSGHKLVKGV
jgi:hypothetical protein